MPAHARTCPAVPYSSFSRNEGVLGSSPSVGFCDEDVSGLVPEAASAASAEGRRENDDDDDGDDGGAGDTIASSDDLLSSQSLSFIHCGRRVAASPSCGGFALVRRT